MCGVIVVDAESFRSTCYGRDAYIMIMPRYSHNYALFYQLLDINLFTHRRILLSWEKPLVKPMAPGSILNISIYNLLYFVVFTLCSYIQNYQKYQTTLSIRSHFVSDRKGIDNPLSRWLRSSYLFVQVRGTRAWSPTGLIPWFSKTEGNTYATVLHHHFLFEGIQRKLEK